MAWGAVAGAAIGVVGGMMSSDAQSGAAQSAADTSSAASKYSADIQKQIFDQQRTDLEPWRQSGVNALGALMYGSGLPQQYQPSSTAKTYDQYRAELLPQYTTTGTNQQQQIYGINPLIRNAIQQQTANAPIIDEAALNAEISKRMVAQQGSQAPVDYSATGVTSGGLLKPFGMADYQADPGYQFRLDEGMKALERSAAARGGLLSGSALKGISRYGQGLASEEYQNAFNRYQANQSNQFNRLASLAGVGQTATNALGQAGQAYAGNVGNLAMTNASNVGNAQLAAGAGRSSAYQGIGSALGSAVGNPAVQNAFSGWYDSATSSAGDPYMGSSNAYYL